MYVAEYSYERVQVMDINGRFIRVFGQEEKALRIVKKYVYVSDFRGHCIVVYETSAESQQLLQEHCSRRDV